MCGIAAWFGRSWGGGADGPVAVVERMLCAVAHRGKQTDPVRGWADGPVHAVMGCRRLAIVDRVHGVQPMPNETGSVFAILNGEIYNHPALRRQLEWLGHRFATHCDTEVLVHGYEEWGDRLPEHLDGMYALAVCDVVAGRYLIARDPVGIKPLYFLRGQDDLLIGSEIKALITSVTGRTAAVELFPPGHVLTETDAAPRPLLTLPEANGVAEPVDAAADRACVARFADLIDQAVRKRVQTDLKVGVFFGGGVDSALVLELARRHHAPVEALVCGLPGSEDVLEAQRYCDAHDVPLHRILVRPEDLITVVPDLVRAGESFEPNLIRNAAFSYLVSQRARAQGFDVCLCGEGADELFAGYAEFRAQAVHRPDRLAELQTLFLRQLHMTQLQRVDRMAMAHTLEVRVPFLDTQIVQFAQSLPRQMMLRPGPGPGGLVDKWVLRQVARDVLGEDPAWRRRKSPISEGGGAGGNTRQGGIFYNAADAAVGNGLLGDMRRVFPQYAIDTPEEAVYFNAYVRDGYTQYAGVGARPTVNATCHGPAETGHDAH